MEKEKKPKAVKDRGLSMQLPISAFFGSKSRGLKVGVDEFGKSIAREVDRGYRINESAVDLEMEYINKKIYKDEPSGFVGYNEKARISPAPTKKELSGGFLVDSKGERRNGSYNDANELSSYENLREKGGAFDEKFNDKIDRHSEIPFRKEANNHSNGSFTREIKSRKSPDSQKTDSLGSDVELLDEFGLFYEENKKPQQAIPIQKKFLLPHEYKTLWERRFVPLLKKFEKREVNSISQFMDNMRALIQVHLDIKQVNIMTLEDFMTKKLSVQEEGFFINELLPFLGGLVLEVKDLFPDGLNVLAKKQKGEVTLNKRQVACLVANMFFCTISSKTEISQLPPIKNFSLLFRKTRGSDEVNLQKIACLYNYFKRYYKDLPKLNVMYQRVSFEEGEKQLFTSESYWRANTDPMIDLETRSTGNIEDSKKCIQVDFANKFLGGGVLNFGCVQEEIRFCISPELFPTLLIMECMEDDEAVLIYGAEQFSNYEGYRGSFKFKGNFRDDASIDAFNRKDVVILAIDARNYGETLSKNVQYKCVEILRELSKAYLGFRADSNFLLEDQGKRPVATGRWGCGAFEGDSQLKFLIQWLAASEAKRKMIFYPYEDKNLNEIELIARKGKKRTIGEFFKLLQSYYSSEYAREKGGKPASVFDYLKLQLR